MQLTAAITLTTGFLTRLKIVCLENEKREAKRKYNDTLKLYVKEMLGRPMEKINVRNKSLLSEDPASFCRMDFTDVKLKALYLWVILLMSSESSKTCFFFFSPSYVWISAFLTLLLILSFLASHTFHNLQTYAVNVSLDIFLCGWFVYINCIGHFSIECDKTNQRYPQPPIQHRKYYKELGEPNCDQTNSRKCGKSNWLRQLVLMLRGIGWVDAASFPDQSYRVEDKKKTNIILHYFGYSLKISLLQPPKGHRLLLKKQQKKTFSSYHFFLCRSFSRVYKNVLQPGWRKTKSDISWHSVNKN